MIPCFVIDGVVVPIGEKAPASSQVETSEDPLWLTAARAAEAQSTKKKVNE